ncbi:hypothetical protein HID58_043781 [Brassica napus]|uniref:Longin domain-containing protein n=2 Tax=Brassica TaxID=3705 RepID=A0A0D3ACM2_BRAOL|nr:hypothetical protein HID58_043781 [Brassica napus]CAF2077990.1 unnamed protein product [Brassica napus]
MMKMTLIARIADGLPLAEGLHDGHDLQDNGVYKEQGMSLIKKLPRGGNEASSVESGAYVFHYITRGRVCCLTMCDHSYPKELAFNYLEDLKSEFERVDGPNIETATRPYEFGIVDFLSVSSRNIPFLGFSSSPFVTFLFFVGTFMHKNGKLYQKETPSLRDLLLKPLTGSLTHVNSMPDDLLERFLGLCNSEELLRIDINNDIYKLTDPVWKRFYQHEFGSKEAELVHQNLGMCDTSFKWSECFHEKRCSEGVYNKYPFAPMARKVRRRVKLLTNMYTPYVEVHEGPSSPKLRPASTSLQQDITSEKTIDLYNITRSDGVEGGFSIENARKMTLVEFLIICPPSQDHSFIDEVVETAAATTITHVSTLPEGRVYRVSATEDFGRSSPSSDVIMQLYEGFRTSTRFEHEIRLIVKEQSRDLKLWAIVHGADMFMKDNGDTVVKISGRKVELDKWFRRLVFLLRRGFFIVPNTNDDNGDDDSDAEEE